jgi:hypothetical protein
VSITIKVIQSTSSQEYIFEKSGPILIGSDEKCDVFIANPLLARRVLEIRLDQGVLSVKNMGGKRAVSMGAKLLPRLEEITYLDGHQITLEDLDYKFELTYVGKEALDPPPFFQEEFKARMELMDEKVLVKEKELRSLEKIESQKKSQAQAIDERMSRNNLEKINLELETEVLKTRKSNLASEIKAFTQKNQDESEKIEALRDHLERLKLEEGLIKDKIVAHNMIFSNLRIEKERRGEETQKVTEELARLQIEANRLITEIGHLEEEEVEKNHSLELSARRIQTLTGEVDRLQADKRKLESMILEKMKITTGLKEAQENHQRELESLEQEKASILESISELKVRQIQNQTQGERLEKSILKLRGEDETLRVSTEEAKLDLLKVADKLALKKNHINKIEFDLQDAQRNLASVHFELDKSKSHMGELKREEQSFELRIQSGREELKLLNKIHSEEKEKLLRIAEEEKRSIEAGLVQIKSKVSLEESLLLNLKKNKNELEGVVQELSLKKESLEKEYKSLHSDLQGLQSQKKILQEEQRSLKSTNEELAYNKDQLRKEISGLRSKHTEAEENFQEQLRSQELELENLKRQEISKIQTQKNLSLAEVEAEKRHGLSELEIRRQKMMDEVYHLKSDAQAQAESITSAARQKEIAITEEASRRLKEATESASLKEKEAEAFLLRARLDSKQLLLKTESELLSDLEKRKIKIKKYLSTKQQRSLEGQKVVHAEHLLKLKNMEEKAAKNLNLTKRKELKKMAKLREEEMAQHFELREKLLHDLRIEKQKGFKEIEAERQRLEESLAEKKKNVLDHINQTKMTQEKSWEEEARREREKFERTKKERIQNASQAVMNVLIADQLLSESNEVELRSKILTTLEMAIDGQKASALKEVTQILDFNPLKRKKMLPTIQRYSLRVGLPAILAIMILTDAGSLRTFLVDSSKDFLKQRESASEIYVSQQKTEWKEKNTFNPAQTPEYKASLSDNVLYTTNFEAIMESEAFQNDWILKVHDFIVRELELSEDTAINYISAEGTLLKELSLARKDLHPKLLDQGLKKMADLEETHLGWMREKFSEPAKLAKFQDFRKSAFDDYAKTKFSPARDIAQEKNLHP